jgi:internalin A
MNPRTSGRLGPVPREILSEGNENCLDRLRDYFDSLSGEVSGVTNVKLFIYGNGEVGKTQLLRCLCPPIEGPTFDVRASTTHGVNVKSFSLSAGVALPRSALGVADSTNIKVRAWDFGGQDLYHGVHSLFLKDRAIHLVAWTPSREGGSSRDSLGYKTANHPLQYWLSFARHRRGDASALIVVQTQADNADDDYKWTPVEYQRMKSDFLGYFSTVATSAKTPRGIDHLIAEIQKASRHITHALDWIMVSNTWLSVENRIEDIQAENESLVPDRRVKRVISVDEFKEIAREAGVISGFNTLLHYLSATGVLISDKALFSNRLIIDQQWALDAIYVIFDRVSIISRLRQASGRFTAHDLSEWIWNDQGYSREEQSLFLSFMLSCRVCFPYSINGGVKTYIAPSALPSMESVSDVLALTWDSDWPTKQSVLEYDLLHDGLLRGLMYEIALLGGANVTFWSNGFQFFDKRTGSRLRLIQERGDSWAGRLVIMVQTHQSRIKSKVSAKGEVHEYDPSLELGAQIMKLIFDQQIYFGIEPKRSHLDFVSAPRAERSNRSSTVRAGRCGVSH